MQPLLGTFVEIGTFDDDSNSANAVSLAFASILEVQTLLSFHDPTSELSLLNRSPGKEITVSPITAKALRLGRAMTRATDGHFNFALGGQLVADGILPNHDDQAALARGKWDDLKMRGTRAQLLRSIKICLDGIAKGLAVDIAINKLKENSLSNGWVNAGGDLRFFGDQDFPVYRRSHIGKPMFLGNFRNCAIATSSIRTKDDARFSGKVLTVDSPVSGCWTVKASSAWIADGLTKAAASLPVGAAGRLLQRFGAELWLDRQVST